MFGMMKNSLFGNTEETEYKLLSSEIKVTHIRSDTTSYSCYPGLGSNGIDVTRLRYQDTKNVDVFPYFKT